MNIIILIQLIGIIIFGGIIMSIIRAFKGLRPKKELVEKIASPPYDVLSSEEARELVRDNPYSFLHVVKPEVDLERGINLYDEKVYKKAAENFNDFIQKGYMIQDNEPKFYIYKQIMGEHSQIGFVGVASVDDYEKGIIKKHELTREEKEIDRTKHILTLNAQAGPVFLVYRKDEGEELNKILEQIESNEPEYDFQSSDGVRHIFWVINDKSLIEKIEKGFYNIPTLYIADGHHRSAAALRVRNIKRDENPNRTGEEPYNFFLTVIFPDNQMKIMAYNRLIKDLNGLTKEELLEKLESVFYIEKTDKQAPEKKHNIVMYLEGEWYCLKVKEGIFDESDPVESLDVQILQKNVISPIFGIENIRKDKRIDFVGGIRGTNYLKELVDSGKFKIAFSMYPTSIDELLRVADAGKIMPPKSTWFEPKLKSGIVVHLLK